MTKKKAPEDLLKAGRPQVYSDEDIAKALYIMGDEAISLKSASAKVGISYSVVRDRISESPELSALYTRETEEYARTKVEQMYEMAKNVNPATDTAVAVARDRLTCDTIKWEAQRVCRKLYGDKTEITGKDGGPIEHAVTLTAEQVRRMAQEIVASTDS